MAAPIDREHAVDEFVIKRIEIAEANGMNEVLVLAEAAQGALSREDPLPLDAQAEAPGALAPVIRALSAL